MVQLFDTLQYLLPVIVLNFGSLAHTWPAYNLTKVQSIRKSFLNGPLELATEERNAWKENNTHFVLQLTRHYIKLPSQLMQKLHFGDCSVT